MNRRQRAAIADATLAAGATLILLFSTNATRAGWSLALGIGLVVLGIALLWGTPRPTMRARMLASTAGLLVGFGVATLAAGPGAWLALGMGALLLAAVLAVASRSAASA